MERIYKFNSGKCFIQMLTGILIVLASTTIQAQVRTTILGKDQDIQSIMFEYTMNQLSPIILPKVDVRKTLEQDRLNIRRLPRIGIKIPVSYTVDDGTWYETDRKLTWKIRFFSEHATALSFQFAELNLPEGSEMWLYSEKRNMVMGPILPEYIHDGILPTDQIFGEEVTLAVVMPTPSKRKFSILVENVIHGIKNTGLEVRDYGDSENCNVNVICSPEGNGWQMHKDAVCKILTGTGTATGVLINNSCRDLTPFILTANHVVTDAPNLNNWVFRFSYESPTCQGIEPSSWLSFFGVDLMASWENTDFALLQLKSSIIGYQELALAGWDRSTNVPVSSTIIHHPEGDVKKISHDSDAPVIDPSPPQPLASNQYYRVEITDDSNGDFGVLEPGSSGAPHFNSFHRIVGNHYGILNVGIVECSDVITAFEGRFHNSWTGGGTNNTRLSNWLGGNDNPITTNTIRVPGMTGDYAICDNNNHMYQVLNPIPGKSISWSVSPGSLFSSSTSGTGSMATLKKSTNAHGVATITFTLSESGCDPVILTRDITVGIPDYMELDIEDNLGDKVLKTCEIVFGETVYTGGDAGITEYEWDLISNSGSWYIESTYSASVPYTDVEIDYYHPFPLPSTEIVRIRARNACGWSWQQETYWTVEDHCNLLGKSQKNRETKDLGSHHLENINFSLYPTLAQNEVHLDWNEGYDCGIFQLSIIDRTGRLVKKSDHMEGNRRVFQVIDLSAGIYFVRIDYKGIILWKRFMVVK